MTASPLMAAALESLLYCAIAIPASLVDIRTKKVPDALTYPGALALCLVVFLFDYPALGDRLPAALLCVVLFLALHVFSKGLGLGDAKFVASTGLLCGLAGSVLALMLASASALAFWAILAARGKANPSTRIPFAPFIAFGTIAAKALVTAIA